MDNDNPYAATTVELSRPLKARSSPSSLLWLILFLPGTVLGLHIGVAVIEGLAAAIRRTSSDPSGAVMFFASFSVCCLALTLIYRIPRWWLLGLHPVRWFSGLLSGTIMTAGAYIAVEVLQKLSGNPVTVSPTAFQWVFIGTVIFVFIVVAVETEALIGRIGTKRSGHQVQAGE